jgi:hypothetical protein
MPQQHTTNVHINPVRINPTDVLRFVLELFTIFTLSLWGFVAWPFPWNLIVGILAPAVTILLWALFRSPKAVFSIDVYGKAVVEIAVLASVAFAWWNLGQPVIAVIVAILTALNGVISGRKEIS